ncbi:uncharacterized protein LOC127604434 [Hippocampus zosterae]|uniref:uncharacterized protein LOC127604434 n=1 Tax=Hippocampus zosterae TaxID=109293 RepID=UPI00223D55AD|nr:uncharacterized protein LOC127604434 [Hippocampus zosterae]
MTRQNKRDRLRADAGRPDNAFIPSLQLRRSPELPSAETMSLKLKICDVTPLTSSKSHYTGSKQEEQQKKRVSGYGSRECGSPLGDPHPTSPRLHDKGGTVMLEQKKGLPLSSEEGDSSFRDSEVEGEMNEVRDAQCPGPADKLPHRSDSLPCAIDECTSFHLAYVQASPLLPNRVIYPRPLGVKENKDCVCAHESEQVSRNIQEEKEVDIQPTARVTPRAIRKNNSFPDIKTMEPHVPSSSRSPDVITRVDILRRIRDRDAGFEQAADAPSCVSALRLFSMTEKAKRWPTKLTPPD